MLMLEMEKLDGSVLKYLGVYKKILKAIESGEEVTVRVETLV